jgi:hypothetical protein
MCREAYVIYGGMMLQCCEAEALFCEKSELTYRNEGQVMQ